MILALCIDSGYKYLRPWDFIRYAKTDLLHQQENGLIVPSREPPHSWLPCLVSSPPKFSDQPLYLHPHGYHFSSRYCNFPAQQLWNPFSPAFPSLIHPPPCTPSAAPQPAYHPLLSVPTSDRVVCPCSLKLKPIILGIKHKATFSQESPPNHSNLCIPHA